MIQKMKPPVTYRVWGVATLCLLFQARTVGGAAVEEDPGGSAPNMPFRLAVVPQTGHSSFIKSVDVSNDGRYVLTGSADGTTKLWDVGSGILLRTFAGTGHVKFVPDGRRMVTCAGESLLVWDLATGVRIRENSIPRNRAVQIDMLSDGHRVLVSYLVGESPIVALFDIDQGKKLREWRDRCSSKENNFFSSVVSKDDKLVLTSCRRGRLSLWELDTGNTRWTRDLHDGTKYQMHFPAFLRIYTNPSMYLGATTVAVSEDGSRIASNGKRGNDDFVYGKQRGVE